MSTSPALTGLWTYYGENNTSYWYWTLTASTASYITQSLPALVQITGTRSWVIVCTILHQILTSRKPTNGFRSALLVQLRNPSSDLGSMGTILSLGWAWRNHFPNRRKEIVGLSLFFTFAVVHLLGWVAASVLTAKVFNSPGNLVRLQTWNPGFTSLKDFSKWQAWHSDQVSAAQSYAAMCYAEQNPGQGGLCASYFRQSIPYTVDLQAACPIDQSLCAANSTEQTMSFDTGQMSSSQYFGINAKEEDSVFLRKTSTCAPLNLYQFSSIQSYTLLDNTTQKYLIFNIGANASLESSSWKWNMETLDTAVIYTIGYDEYLHTTSNISTIGWTPRLELFRNNTDISLNFIAMNAVRYFAPVFDPLFYATVEEHLFYDDTGKPANFPAVYVPNNPVGVVACYDQSQICNPVNGQCTELSGTLQLLDYFWNLVGANISLWPGNNTIGLNEKQFATAARLAFINSGLVTGVITWFLGDQALNISSSINKDTLVGPGMPNNQWQIEVIAWWQTNLAWLQSQVGEFIRKDVAALASLPANETMPVTPEFEFMLSNQIATAGTGYTTFSMKGVVIVLGVSAFVIALSFCIDGVFGAAYAIGGRERYLFKVKQWRADGLFQLWRAAHEARQSGSWTKHRDSIPVSLPDVLLKSLYDDDTALNTRSHGSVSYADSTYSHSLSPLKPISTASYMQARSDDPDDFTEDVSILNMHGPTGYGREF